MGDTIGLALQSVRRGSNKLSMKESPPSVSMMALQKATLSCIFV